MLQLNNLSLEPETKVVSATEYQSVLDAEGIVAAANEQAQQILADARAEYDRQKKQGYDDGVADGQMEISEEMVDVVSKSVDYFSKLEGRVVELVSLAIKKVIGEMDDRDRITAIVKQALAVARTQAKVTVRVCPDDVDAVNERLGEIMRPYPAIQFVDVVSDSRLPSSGCILETEVGVVDASIDVQLKAIESSLSKFLGDVGTKT
jgi:type III secretion protein L